MHARLEAEASNPRYFLSHNQGSFSNNRPHNGLAELDLLITLGELSSYVAYRETGLTRKLHNWIERAAKAFWHYTNGNVNKNNLCALRTNILQKYRSEDARSKILSFAAAFLKYLTKTRLDNRYHAFSVFLEKPKTLKHRKRVTNRIIMRQDIEQILTYIKTAESERRLNAYRTQQYTALTLFGAFTGQRSNATTSKLTVQQFREALQLEKPVIHVKASQDKIRIEHYVPLHPQVIAAIQPLLNGRRDDSLVFEYNSFWMWVKRQKIPLS